MATTVPSSNSAVSDTTAGEMSSSTIDNRRAQQLVERAMALAERNDLQAAVLACRQSISLAPESVQGYSMLGLLLERAGDSAGAITAYEKVLQLAPDSLLERESLGRLRVNSASRRTSRDMFVFDEAELFGDERPDKAVSVQGNGAMEGASKLAPKVSPVQSVTNIFKKPAPEPEPAVAVAPVAVVAPVEAPAMSPNATPSTQAAIALDAIASANAVASTPVVGVSRTSPPLPSRLPASIGPRLPQSTGVNMDWTPKPLTLSQKLRQRPSFYFLGAPLAATSVVCLGFLFWAQSYATSRAVSEVSSGIDSPANTSTTPNPANGSAANANPAVANPGTPAANPAAPATTTGGTVTAPNTATQTPGAPSGARPAPPATRPAGSGVPATPTAPAASPGAAAPSDSGNETYPSLPPPRLGAPAPPDDTVRIAPNDGGQASSGGVPLNPGGTPGQGYVRVSPGGNARPPARPDSAAASDERASGSSARNGDSDAAIARMSRSIESGGGDTAFRYQQRAQLYLQSGDNNRAINDYQAAIAAYNDMIARGERASFARSGIQASQRGIQVAQSRR